MHIAHRSLHDRSSWWLHLRIHSLPPDMHVCNHSYNPDASWQATVTSLARRRRRTRQAPALGRQRQPLVGQAGQAYGARANQAWEVSRKFLNIAVHANACLGQALARRARLGMEHGGA